VTYNQTVIKAGILTYGVEGWTGGSDTLNTKQQNSASQHNENNTQQIKYLLSHIKVLKHLQT